MSRKKISTTIYVTPEQNDRLKQLHDRTKVPVAVYIREGIDLVLKHYAHLLPGQLTLDGRATIERALDARARENRDRNDDPPPPRKSERNVARDSETLIAASGGKK